VSSLGQSGVESLGTKPKRGTISVEHIRWSLSDGRELGSVFKNLAMFGVAFVGVVFAVVGTCNAQVEVAPPPITMRPYTPPVPLTPTYQVPLTPTYQVPLANPPAIEVQAPSAVGGPPPAMEQHAEGGDCEVAYRNCANSYCFPLDHSKWNSYRECIGDMCKIDSKSCLQALVDDLEGRE
jgi:hypothetical protein